MSSKLSCLKRHVKSGKIFFSDTKLVVKSASEKIVIGRIFNDDFLPLDKEAINLSKQIGLQYDKNLLEETEEETEHQETNEEEETKHQETNEEEETKHQETNEEEETKHQETNEEEETKHQETKHQETKHQETERNEKELFSDILKINFKYIENSYKKYEKETNDKISLLETELDTTKKELQEVKKKLKGVLIAMQNSLE